MPRDGNEFPSTNVGPRDVGMLVSSAFIERLRTDKSLRRCDLPATGQTVLMDNAHAYSFSAMGQDGLGQRQYRLVKVTCQDPMGNVTCQDHYRNLATLGAGYR